MRGDEYATAGNRRIAVEGNGVDVVVVRLPREELDVDERFGIQCIELVTMRHEEDVFTFDRRCPAPRRGDSSTGNTDRC